MGEYDETLIEVFDERAIVDGTPLYDDLPEEEREGEMEAFRDGQWAVIQIEIDADLDAERACSARMAAHTEYASMDGPLF